MKLKFTGKQARLSNMEVINYELLESNDESLFCKCCGMPTFKVAPKFNMCVNIMKLGDLGTGFPLYFHSKIFTGIIYFFMFIIVGIP
jgi:hypothetical protein